VRRITSALPESRRPSGHSMIMKLPTA